jgi:hypothetical protein
MSDYAEFTILFGLLASGGLILMTNVKVELWCEQWLERILLQPFARESSEQSMPQNKKAA